MSSSAIEWNSLKKGILALFDEAYLGTADPKSGTWFSDNEPGNGFLGAIEGLSAAEASRPLTPGDPLTIASHVEHLRFALDLADRSLRGEDAYAGAKWGESWLIRTVDEAAWRELVEALRSEYSKTREAIEALPPPDDAMMLTGTLSLVAHGAWHLGAIKQGLGAVRAPK